ncbi:MAG: HD-GYP domain-containing protein [Veillonellales bacterium]
MLIASSSQTKPEIINYFLELISKYDPYTATHSLNVKKLSVELATRLNLSPKMINDISTAALLHDIGKMKISKNILTKSGKLSTFEYEIIKQHSEYGYQILNNLDQLKDIANAVLYHHEKFNGTGYPTRKSGETIPLISRILAISDVYDAITSDRCYRIAMSQENALKVIWDGRGTAFDPLLVDTFLIDKIGTYT